MTTICHDLKKERHGQWRCSRCKLVVFTTQVAPKLPGPCSPAKEKREGRKKKRV